MAYNASTSRPRTVTGAFLADYEVERSDGRETFRRRWCFPCIPMLGERPPPAPKEQRRDGREVNDCRHDEELREPSPHPLEKTRNVHAAVAQSRHVTDEQRPDVPVAKLTDREVSGGAP